VNRNASQLQIAVTAHAVLFKGIMMQRTGKTLLALAACGLLAMGAAPANAKGCLKGAAVGGLAGHAAGHGVLGAAGGCAVGHHMANKKAQQESSTTNQSYERSSVPNDTANRP
jgi:hypothetical protein